MAPRKTHGDHIDRSAFVVSNTGHLVDFYDCEKNQMGSGSYGCVCKAYDKKTKAARACKAMARKNIKNEKRFFEEIEIMRGLDHPNIIRLYETFKDHKNIYLILELCTGGELFDKIVAAGKKKSNNIVEELAARAEFQDEIDVL